VAPFIGTGEKMKHEPAFPINDRLVKRSRSRDRRCRALSAIPHTRERQAFVGIGHHFDGPGVGAGQREIPDAGLAAVKAMMFCIRNRPPAGIEPDRIAGLMSVSCMFCLVSAAHRPPSVTSSPTST